MILYHFTPGAYLRGIAQYGLTVGDVPTSIREHKGKIGVWLTSSDASTGHGLDGAAIDKTRFRLTVDCPEDNLVKWSEWAPLNVDVETRRALSAAEGHNAASWYVYFGHIRPTCIIEVTDMQSGETVPEWGTFWPEGDQDARAVKYEGRFAWHNRMMRDVKRALRQERGL